MGEGNDEAQSESAGDGRKRLGFAAPAVDAVGRLILLFQSDRRGAPAFYCRPRTGRAGGHRSQPVPAR